MLPIAHVNPMSASAATKPNTNQPRLVNFMIPVLPFKRFEDFPIPFVPAEGNAPSLAHLGQAALVRR
jgi:hypothetical protein